MMQHTPCTCQGNITSPNCCHSPLPLPSCRGNHVLTQVPKSILGHRWSERGVEFGQRKQLVWEKTCLASSADHGATSKVETWKERLQNSDYAGPLTTNITRRLSAKKRTSVPFYLLSKQSGTDFLNASSWMVAIRGPKKTVRNHKW